MDNFNFFACAYLIVAGVLFFYINKLHGDLKKLEKQIQDLKK